MDFEPPERCKEATYCWRGRQDCRKTAWRCSAKLFFKSITSMHRVSEKRKTPPHSSRQLFLVGPSGEKRPQIRKNCRRNMRRLWKHTANKFWKLCSPLQPEAIFQNMFAVCLHSLPIFEQQYFLVLAHVFHPLDPIKTAACSNGELFWVFLKIDA